jgi:hypothetical protein
MLRRAQTPQQIGTVLTPLVDAMASVRFGSEITLVIYITNGFGALRACRRRRIFPSSKSPEGAVDQPTG